MFVVDRVSDPPLTLYRSGPLLAELVNLRSEISLIIVPSGSYGYQSETMPEKKTLLRWHTVFHENINFLIDIVEIPINN